MGFYPTGRGFESLRVYQNKRRSLDRFLFWPTRGIQAPDQKGRGEDCHSAICKETFLITNLFVV